MPRTAGRSEEHTSELQSQSNLVCRLLLEKKKQTLYISPVFNVASEVLMCRTLPNQVRFCLVHSRCHLAALHVSHFITMYFSRSYVFVLDLSLRSFFFFFFNDTATTEIYTLSLHDALPICFFRHGPTPPLPRGAAPCESCRAPPADRKSTRLNSSHSQISYAVFCLKKKNKHCTYHRCSMLRPRSSCVGLCLIRSDSVWCTHAVTLQHFMCHTLSPCISHALTYSY